MLLFVPHLGATLCRPRHALPSAPRCSPTRPIVRCVKAPPPSRALWPINRFLKTLLFYSPLGKLTRMSTPDPADALRARRGAVRTKEGVYLVTGAAGGTGKRVVRDLLAIGKAVRALVRSREPFMDAMAELGVDAVAAERNGSLQVLVGDLYNLRDEFFDDVVAIASCTGTRVGPAEDAGMGEPSQPSPPVVLGDTPEKVEYIGIQRLMESAAKHFNGPGAPKDDETLPVLEFKDEETIRAQWGPLDDVVMGGVSSSTVAVDANEGHLVIRGNVSDSNFGGFASARTVNFDQAMNLGDYDGLVLRVKGDGKNYKLILRCDSKWDGLCYCYTFPTSSNEWTDVRIPFSLLKVVFRAKTLPNGEPFNPSSVTAFQIMLSKFEYDGELNPNFMPGPFELRVASVSAYKSGAAPPCPRVVHIGSAGVTRVLRADEFDTDSLPPAVQLNDQLGRIMEWKFAGEDVIRTSSIPYFILRPCGLTENEGVGVESLKFEQGDRLTGQVSRDDLAALVVKAFTNPALTDVTVEVAQTRNGEDMAKEQVGNERLAKLSKDAEGKREYATYPFIPDV